MTNYSKRMEELIRAFSRMPGIGQKSAERLAFYILRASKDEAEQLATLIRDVKATLRYCRTCFNLSESEQCLICQDLRRDHALLCVVEEPKDILTLEKSRSYRGLYHVLLGSLSPLDGIGPEELKIKELLERLKTGKMREVILATDSDTEGETTALYLSKLLKELKVKVTRLAAGLPVGSHIEYTDEATLAKALEGRREL
ncbi:MAG: recombination protein RecR [Candidatus Omnitrophica bacterium]|nr:recombination protein RecR [Candidatus Omnitrophota bacterium]